MKQRCHMSKAHFQVAAHPRLPYSCSARNSQLEHSPDAGPLFDRLRMLPCVRELAQLFEVTVVAENISWRDVELNTLSLAKNSRSQMSLGLVDSFSCNTLPLESTVWLQTLQNGQRITISVRSGAWSSPLDLSISEVQGRPRSARKRSQPYKAPNCRDCFPPVSPHLPSTTLRSGLGLQDPQGPHISTLRDRQS